MVKTFARISIGIVQRVHFFMGTEDKEEFEGLATEHDKEEEDDENWKKKED